MQHSGSQASFVSCVSEPGEWCECDVEGEDELCPSEGVSDTPWSTASMDTGSTTPGVYWFGSGLRLETVTISEPEIEPVEKSAEVEWPGWYGPVRIQPTFLLPRRLPSLPARDSVPDTPESERLPSYGQYLDQMQFRRDLWSALQAISATDPKDQASHANIPQADIAEDTKTPIAAGSGGLAPVRVPFEPSLPKKVTITDVYAQTWVGGLVQPLVETTTLPLDDGALCQVWDEIPQPY